MSEIQETQQVKSSILIYTEQTPNQEALKFVTNRKLYNGSADFSDLEKALDWSPFAADLFELPYVKSVHINNNYISIEKEFSYSWRDIMLPIKEFIKGYITSGAEVVREGYAEMIEKERAERRASGDETEIISRIIQIIDEYIKPGIEMDGGNIEFISYDDGIVTVSLQGACRTCSSATYTLQAGVQRILSSMVPEVKEVIQDFS